MSGPKSASGLSGSQSAGSFERQFKRKGENRPRIQSGLHEVYFNRVEEKLSLYYSRAAAEIYGVKSFPLVDVFKLLIRRA